MTNWVRIAEIVKTKTLEGELIVRSAIGSSFILRTGDEVYFVPPRIGFPRSGVVTSINRHKAESFVVKFDSVPDIDTAEALIGCSVLVSRAIFEEGEDYTEFDLLDCRVIDDRHGDLGLVVEVLEGKAQVLLRVEGSLGQLLIPKVPEIVYDEDLEARMLSTRIPKGLVDLAVNAHSSK
ncbi:MAG: ribosome maturation factor RimM [Raoultibacter sp.]|jgi:16S rRNA processing protein RimM